MEKPSNIKISVNNISKVFKMYNTPMDKLKEAFSVSGKCRHTDFYAITDLSFDVYEGEILGIMGRNGSGKSTLLKMITGIFEPTTGDIDVSGRISSLLELGTGFNMEYTGIENIFFYGTLMGMSKEVMQSRVQSIIDFAEIGDYVYQPVKTYSSGMFARLAFSCAINVEPEILIVDEILSVGDMRFQAKCFNKFKEFKESGVTILYVGHDVGMMRTFCDKALWINNGKMVDIGDPTYISAKYTEFMYLEDINEFTSYKLHNTEKVNESKEDNSVQAEENAPKDNIIASDKMYPNSIAHWGTNVGLIDKIEMLGEDNKEKNYFGANEKIKVRVCFSHDDSIEYEYLSVAISIKDKEGTDIIVKTTYDEGITLVMDKSHIVEFEFISCLANKDYYLVVALENRKNANITYYEYIEGAKYFKMYTPKKIFGIFDVDAEIRYEHVNGRI